MALCDQCSEDLAQIVKPIRVVAYTNLGNAHDSLGNYQEALKYHEQDLAIARELRDREEEGKAYANIGNVYLSLGNYWL